MQVSLKSDNDDFIVDPSLIYDDFQKRVDIVIDGEMGSDEPSTIVDCTTHDF
jgi:tRNA A37 threonylcarbamoyladenosine synthetase subunit TsaC/SUA5/YrdC